MIRDFVRKILRWKYAGINRLDRKLEKFVDYDNGYFQGPGAEREVLQSERPSAVQFKRLALELCNCAA